ncbi:hypothetical protein COO60DRAFT_1706680 [Scenedesmus sp. NREL 46B-D3]|nr:hypothetical protein COO60DRAFT_1706680 [Scenedesmus sp. NREL 46B-D3]
MWCVGSQQWQQLRQPQSSKCGSTCSRGGSRTCCSKSQLHSVVALVMMTAKLLELVAAVTSMRFSASGASTRQQQRQMWPAKVPIVGLDVDLPLGLPAPVTVGKVYQQFSSVQQGSVQNIIEFTVPFLLEQQQGATFTVDASYEVRSGRRIALVFEEAHLGKVRISPLLEALLAPALLPRGYLNQQLLLALRELNLVFPFRSAQQVAQGLGVAAPYLLTYLDEDMLIGRASGTAGTFIFRRVPPD